MTCAEGAAACSRADNMGWRYFLLCMGGLALAMFVLRFVCFTIFESPKYLMGKGRDADAVRVVHEVARRNGKPCGLRLEDLERCGQLGGSGGGAQEKTATATAAVRRRLEVVGLAHVRPLFGTKQLAWSMTLITLVWAFVGLGFPLYNAFLPYIQATRGADFGDGSTYLTYRNSLIIAVLGVPGCLLGGVLVEVKRVGRKGRAGPGRQPDGHLSARVDDGAHVGGAARLELRLQLHVKHLYAVLYAYTPEIFPPKDRGTGNAITASANRVFGILAPIIAMFANLQTSVPVYVSGGLFMAAGLTVLMLPFESRGRRACSALGGRHVALEHRRDIILPRLRLAR